MTTDDFNESTKIPSSVRSILERELPLANGRDWPVGPVPYFRIEQMLLEAFQAGERAAFAQILDLIESVRNGDLPL